MTTSQPGVRTPASDTTQTLKRRGLLAAAAAFVAGLVARFSETSVSAGVDGDVVLGSFNNAASTTEITTSGGIVMQLISGGSSGTALLAEAGQYAFFGQLTASGPSGAGVFAAGRANSPGVWGVNTSSGIGVRGDTLTGNAVFGQVPQSSTANTIAIYAQNFSKYAGPSPGAGGFAIYGLCAKGHGLVGATAAPGAAAVVGATNGVPGAYAGAFYGPVSIAGDFTVVGGAKSAAVPHPDGTHRRLYCLESPESWFEDFGTGRLECGRAAVTIDPDFAAMVDLTDYHVFLTERGRHHALTVTAQTPTGFTVEADADDAAIKGKTDRDLSGTFSWRVVARRRDIKGERLEPVTIPPEPTLPPVPDTPAPPDRWTRSVAADV